MAFCIVDHSKPIENSSQRQFIFHVDLDAFYAAVEMREDPSLVGKPIIVGGNRETKRGVAVTCNYEARKYGIHSGMPTRKALELCPDLICVSRNHSLYGEVSDNIMDILSSYTDQFRSASIDEAYLNLTSEIEEDYNGYPIPLAQEIQQEIYEKEKISSSIGIGPNTTIAKIATGQYKPKGITYVPSEAIKRFLTPLPLKKISGIGKKTYESIKRKHGIETIGQIIEIEDEHLMVRKFGRLGSFFYKVINGIGRTNIIPNNDFGRKSISKGRTFIGQKIDGEPVTADDILPGLINQVHERLTKRSFYFKTITLEARLQSNFQNLTRSKSFQTANDDKELITSTVFEILNGIKKDFNNPELRKVAVRVSNFIKKDTAQKSITDYFN
ncbi:MAG: DNA polymerase IV [Asgard group archaeon]|nr:DNA polymerase IV [Asgard group archaeon]